MIDGSTIFSSLKNCFCIQKSAYSLIKTFKRFLYVRVQQRKNPIEAGLESRRPISAPRDSPVRGRVDAVLSLKTSRGRLVVGLRYVPSNR
jgi:hypothetical protein